MRAWLTSTAALPEFAQAAAHGKGGERYDKFFEALGRRLAKGPRPRLEVPEDMRAGHDGSMKRRPLDRSSHGSVNTIAKK
jgi:hypothetical protein